ncbi:P21 protein (Cdc42/Rac)-activated kinase 4 [Aphelenchoides avenae]|nr:P21 protein (Cdc42/Rac)-activated kinase 4 [Aphelenchus avenae]
MRRSFRRIKKVDISEPVNFEHRIHAVIDPQTGSIRGLPKQWQSLLVSDTPQKRRPRPVVDPCFITPGEVAQMKTIVRGTTPKPGQNSLESELETPSTSSTKSISNGSFGNFQEAIRSVVDPGDPREMLEKFEMIGEGSTGVVMRARTIGGGNFVAVKRMNINRQQRRELLFNEAMVVKALRHPNIVTCFGSHLVGNELWVVMEYMGGGTLTNVVTKVRMTEAVIAAVARQCLEALAFIHSHNIVHRDIKSDSILIGSDGTIKLSDFGFCGQLTKETPKRRSMLGTPYWLSYQLCAREPYGTDADIWSFGITVYEMVMGEPPYFSDEPDVAMRKIIDLPAPRIPAEAKAS